MAEYIINGGASLRGEIRAQGSKNSAVAVIMACLMVKGKVVIHRVPRISDVMDCIDTLKCLGAKIEWIASESLLIDCENVYLSEIPSDICGRMRATTYLMGAELSRFGECVLPEFGGCDLGSRPIDLHGLVFGALGAVCTEGGRMKYPSGKASSANIRFPRVTVGGTINALLAAVLCYGETVLCGCAKEPHVCDVAEFLNLCGADITGIGTDVLRVRGVKRLRGCEFKLSGDMIEAGTYIIAAVATRGRVTVKDINGIELLSLGSVLRNMGARVELGRDYAMVDGKDKTVGVAVSSGEYPGFPTDMHPQMVVLMSLSQGASVFEERIFGDKRFAYVGQLKKQGLVATTAENKIYVDGNGMFLPANVSATDLRGGAAMTVAALTARGESRISNISYIKRGYSDLVGKLSSLGAVIREE